MKKLIFTLFFTLGSVYLFAQEYTLQNEDVTIVNGVITNCSYDFAIKNITIPENLDKQTIVGIDNGYYQNGVHKAASKSSQDAAYDIDSLIYQQSGISYKEVISYDESNNNFTILKQIHQSGWVNNYLSTFTYDDNGNLVTELYEDWDSETASWVPDQRKTSTYDENNNQLTYLYENLDNDNENWIASRRYTNTYDDDNYQLSQKREDWSSESSSWSTYQLIAFTYDDGGNMLTTEWDYISNIWTDDQLSSYTYDSTGNLTIYSWAVRKPKTSDWINDTRYLYTYDSLGNLLIEQAERWNIYIDEWYTAERAVYTYDSNGNEIDLVYEVPILNTDTFKATSYRFYYSYNEKNELSYELTEKWHIIDSIWFEYGKKYYEYDSFGNLIYFASDVLDNGNWKPSNSTISFEINEKTFSYQVEEVSLYYSAVTTESPSAIAEEPFILYPNPANTYVFFNVGQSVAIFDIKGVLVKAYENAGSIDISDLNSGVYFVRNGKGKIRKLVIE